MSSAVSPGLCLNTSSMLAPTLQLLFGYFHPTNRPNLQFRQRLLLTRLNDVTFCLQEERKGKIDSELATVISSISLACKQIAAAVGRSGISSLTGVAGTGENVQVRQRTVHCKCG